MTLVGLAIRNATRNKFRTALTVLGVAVAVFTFVLLRTVLTSWTAASAASRKNLLVTRHKLSLVFWLPLRYVDDIKQLPGVADATPGVWFAGTNPKETQFFFPSIAVEPKYYDIDTDVGITAAEKAALVANKRGAVVGDALAEKFAWKVGDRVSLNSPRFPAPPDNPWTFEIVAIYRANNRNVDRNTFYLRFDLLNETLPPNDQNRVGWIVVKLKDGETSANVTRAIDNRFEGSEAPTLSQDERTFRTQFLAGINAVLQGLNAVSIVIIIIMLLILGNTIAMGVRERTPEYGTLRAIGFLPRHVVLFILGEAMMTGIMGGTVGVLLAVPTIQYGMSAFIERNVGGVFPSFRVEVSTVIVSLVLSAGLGILAAVIPAMRAARIQVTEALRRV